MFVASHTAPSRACVPVLEAPPLTAGARVEVCIVGAGIAGLIAAYLLARERRSVMVLDEGPVGGVHGGLQAAHLASVVEKPYAALEEESGPDVARVAAQGCAAAIDALEAIVRREHLACEFERLDGYHVVPPGAAAEHAQREYEAARRAGVPGVEFLAHAPLEGAAWGPCVRYPGQAQFHPARFLAGLARAIAREGGRLHCGVSTRFVEAGSPTTLVTAGGHRIVADTVVAAHPVGRSGLAQAPAAPRIAHVIGLRIPRGSVTRALYWESGDAARWVRLRSHGSGAGEVLLVGGEDPAGDDDDHTAYRYLALERWARERFPRAGDVTQRFTGQVLQGLDVFAFAGRGDADAQALYVATGSWGTALARAAIAGLAIKDFVDGAETPWSELYVPEACRVPPRRPAPGASL